MKTMDEKYSAVPVLVLDEEEAIEDLAAKICAFQRGLGEEFALYSPDPIGWGVPAAHEKLQSVLAATFCTYFGQSPAERFADLFDQATYLAQHLAKDHLFQDGNKRTALVTVLHSAKRRRLRGVRRYGRPRDEPLLRLDPGHRLRCANERGTLRGAQTERGHRIAAAGRYARSVRGHRQEKRGHRIAAADSAPTISGPGRQSRLPGPADLLTAHVDDIRAVEIPVDANDVAIESVCRMRPAAPRADHPSSHGCLPF